MSNKVIVMDFTGVYDMEPFSKHIPCSRLDCRNITGTDCYCDNDAAKELKKMISKYPVHGIHFIDSGDYHYMTKFWTDRIKHPFSLIVFDHHPDMQQPVFDNIISCGGWVRDMLDNNPFLRKVIIIGASDKLIRSVPETYKDRVHFYSETSLEHESTWHRYAKEHLNEPVYISIDKDVLNTSSAATNWDQGSMSLAELKKLLAVILHKEDIIGIDICGECKTDEDIISEEKDTMIDSKANESLLKLFATTTPSKAV